MKKQYKKPLVAVEHFSIVHTAAKDCWDNIPQDQVNFNSERCGWDIGSAILFLTSVLNSSCTLDGDGFGMVCYNNPAEGKYIFRS